MCSCLRWTCSLTRACAHVAHTCTHSWGCSASLMLFSQRWLWARPCARDTMPSPLGMADTSPDVATKPLHLAQPLVASAPPPRVKGGHKHLSMPAPEVPSAPPHHCRCLLLPTGTPGRRDLHGSPCQAGGGTGGHSYLSVQWEGHVPWWSSPQHHLVGCLRARGCPWPPSRVQLLSQGPGPSQDGLGCHLSFMRGPTPNAAHTALLPRGPSAFLCVSKPLFFPKRPAHKSLP